jgi:hypothetical protein
MKNHARSHGIDQHFIPLHVWELGGNFRGAEIPEYHPISLRIALGNNSQSLSWSRAGHGKGESHDSLYTMASED